MTAESNKELLTIPEIEPSILWERQIGPSQITRKETVFLDKEKGKLPVLYTVVRASPEAMFGIAYDEGLAAHGIKIGAGELLIDQEATKLSLGREAGRLPEVFIKDYPNGTISFCPSNFGWQKDAFFIINGQLILLNNDRGKISGRFGTVGLSQKKWESTETELKNGEIVSPPKFNRFELGLSLPLILKDNRTVPLKEMIGDSRFLADLRNVVDFGTGKKLPGEFWLYLRVLLPTTEIAGKRLTEGRQIVVRRPGLSLEETKKLVSIIKDNQLEKWLRVGTRREVPRLAVVDRLPLNRIPVVGVGFNQENQLLIVAADGRQEKSAGVTVEELAWLMKKEGALTAGLGSAGGDVAVVAKTEKGIEILNSPSNRDHKTRFVPSVLTISPHSD